MAQGWISIYRFVMEHWIYDDGTPFDRMHAWLDLLLLASHEDHKFISNGTLYESKRGEINRSITSLADRWHWSRWKAKHFLDQLQADGMISYSATPQKPTAIHVENYSKYQNPPTGDRQLTDRRPTGDRQATDIYNNGDKVKTMDNNGERGVKRPRFSPPSVQDVEAYCKERGYAIDAQRFVDFYQSKGWMVGKSPMKDWKAAVRSWASRHEKEDRHVTNDDWSFMDL